MDNPFGPPSRRRGQSPPAKNNFQHELHAKMYERKKKGLTADVTPSESGQSEDELGSDNGKYIISNAHCVHYLKFIQSVGKGDILGMDKFSKKKKEKSIVST